MVRRWGRLKVHWTRRVPRWDSDLVAVTSWGFSKVQRAESMGEANELGPLSAWSWAHRWDVHSGILLETSSDHGLVKKWVPLSGE